MPDPLRILHISTRLILGGSQENTVLSCEGQAERGHEVHLAFGPIYGPEGSLLERVEGFRTSDGRSVVTHVVPHLVREVRAWSDVRCYFELRQLITRIRPDIVHTHSSKAGILGRAAAWSVWKRGGAGRPAVVHTIHGPPFHEHERAWRNAVYVRAERFAARRCHLIVSVADAMTERFLARGIGDPSLYRTVRSGMEVEDFLAIDDDPERRGAVRARHGIPDDAVVLGTIARLAEHKGHDDLLDAMRPIIRERADVRLMWVGDGWWHARLVARARGMGMGDRLVLTGLVPPDLVPDCLSAMDVLVHPSYREGLPRTVVQAMLAGRGVIAYDCDGTGEVVEDGVTGRLVRVGDVPGLERAVRWMLEDLERAHACGQRGRARCRTPFSGDHMVEELEQVYADALARAEER
ncbi:MAG: glycosyltransferase family 4 protein [Phycisphaerales bacterium]